MVGGTYCTAAGIPFRYTGQRLDPETALYYYRARYYSSAYGRFNQNDTVGYIDDLNLYTYLHNDPTNSLDPSGNGSQEGDEIRRNIQREIYSNYYVGHGIYGVPRSDQKAMVEAVSNNHVVVQVVVVTPAGSGAGGIVTAGVGVDREGVHVIASYGGVGGKVEKATPYIGVEGLVGHGTLPNTGESENVYEGAAELPDGVALGPVATSDENGNSVGATAGEGTMAVSGRTTVILKWPQTQHNSDQRAPSNGKDQNSGPTHVCLGSHIAKPESDPCSH